MPFLGASPVGLVPSLPGLPVPAAQDATPGLQPPLAAGLAPWVFVNNQVGGSGTSRVFTVPANQPPTQQGDTLLITLNIASSAMTVSAVVDNAGNTYTLDNASITTAPQMRNYRCANANPVAPGNTVTVTTSATNATLCLGGICIPGGAWEGVPDVISGTVTHFTTATSQAFSVTPTQDYDLILVINVNQSIGGPNYTDPPFYGWWINTQVAGTNEITWSYLPCGAGTAGVAQTCNVHFGQANNGYITGFAFKANQIALAEVAAAVDSFVNAPAYQVATGLTTGAVTARTATVSQGTSAGDTLLALVTSQATACTISSFTDARGNVYTLDRSVATPVPLAYYFRSPGATGGPGGTPTVALQAGDIVTATSAAQTGNVEILLVSAGQVGAVDQISAVASGTTGTPAVSATPTADNETCVALMAVSNTGGQPAITNAAYGPVATYHTGVNPWSFAAAQDLGTGTSGVTQNFTAAITPIQWNAVQYTFQQFVAAAPKMATFTDAFPGTTLSSQWAASGTGSVAVSGGQVAITGPGGASGVEQIQSVSAYDLTGSYLMAQLPAAGAQQANTQALLKIVGPGTNNVAQIFVANGSLNCQHEAAGTWSGFLATAAYSPGAMQFLRIREAGGTTFYEYSADGVNWATLFSEADPFTMTSVNAQLQQYNGATDPAATAAWAGVNVIPAAVALGDVAGAAEQQAVQVAVGLADAGGAAEALSPAVAVSLADAAAAIEALSAGIAPYVIGAGSSSTGSVAITPTTLPGAGDTILVITGSGTTGLTIAGVTDPAGNGYTLDNSAGPGRPVNMAYVIGANAWASGQITVTMSGTQSHRVLVVGIPAAAGIIAADRTPAAVGSGTATTTPGPVTTGALAQGGEYCIGALAVAATPVPTVSWPLIGTSGNSPTVIAGWLSPGATTASQTMTGTVSPAEAWGGGVITFTTGAPPSAVAEADVAAAADALAVQVAVPLADAGAAAEAPTVAAAVPLAEQAAGADSATAAVAVPLADRGGAADTATQAVSVPLADAGAGADALGPPSAAVPLADSAGAVDAVSVGGTASPALPDAAGATDAISVAETTSLADAAGATDALAVQVSVPLADAAGAAEAVSSAASVPLADRAAGADALAVPSESIPQADAAGAADSLSVAETTSLPDQAGAADTLAPPAVAAPLPDAGGAADQITAAVTSPAADVAGAADALSVAQAGQPVFADAAGAADSATVAAAVPVADQAAAADALAVSMPVALTDTGAAGDAIGAAVSAPLADRAAATEQISTPAAVPLAEAAGAADAISVAVGASPALPDVAGAADQISVAETTSLPDAAGAADALTVAVSVPLADVAGAADAEVVLAGATPQLADAAGAADALAVAETTGLPDAAGAADALAVQVAVPLAERAGAADAAGVGVQVPLADAAGAADGLGTVQAGAPVLADAGAATDALSAAVSTAGHDTAAASDGLAVVVGIGVSVSDSAGAADSLAVTVPVIGAQPVWRCGAAAQRWSCEPAPSHWTVAAATVRWETEPSHPRWAVKLSAARWEPDYASV